MPSVIRCPSCSRALQLPEALEGQTVQCPTCQTTFIGRAEMSTEPAPAPEPPGAFSPSPESFEREASPPPAPLPGYYGSDEEDYTGPRRGYGASRSAALAAVSGPATGLQVVSGIALALLILGLTCSCVGVGFLGGQGPRGGRANDADLLASVVARVVALIVGICWAGIIFVGAGKMKNLESYGYAMTACITALIPCTLCFLFTLPFGIWGLVVISRPEVKSQFRGMPGYEDYRR